MTPFKAPLDDILFSLTHVARAERVPGWQPDVTRDVAAHFAALAEGVIAPLNAIGDRQGARFHNGRVRMPEGFRAAYEQIARDGWFGLGVPEQFGGMGLDAITAAVVSEVFSGANQALQMLTGLGPGAVRVLLRHGTEAQQQRWVPQIASGQVLATMCLSEPGAGSDLSAIRTRAREHADGWRIDGEKIFISGGDQDLSEGILHLVLARSGSPQDGVRGLSLFLCTGDDPAVRVSRIEEKLGLHASPTCQMVFDGARAELLGQPGQGLAAMFALMNHARLDVALQGVAQASRAHQIAADYAATRKQGRTAEGRAAVLSDHADVRRMLDEQRALALGARAMAHVALVELQIGNRPALADFLTPLCKIFCSQAGIRAADLGIQVLGGYGYLHEYGLSQVWRDARITAIYEGANGIHARSLATRGLREGDGADEFDALIGEITDNAGVLRLRGEWREARAIVAASPEPAAWAHDFAGLTTALFYRAVWSRIAQVSGEAEHARLNARVQAAPLPVRMPFTVPG